MASGSGFSRRRLLRDIAASGLVLRGSAAAQINIRYDVLIRSGLVVDPASGVSVEADVAVAAGKVARVAGGIPASQAAEIIDATGCIVTPGLVDAHVHVYDGVAPLGIPPDPDCIAKGVTTVLDGGSAGAHTFPAFRKHTIETAATRIYALLNIAVMGQSTFSLENPHGELLDLRYVNPDVAAAAIERHRDRILGLKVRLTRNVAGDHDLEVLRRTVQAARTVRLPVMAHIGGSRSPLKKILALLRPGDVITHALREGEGGILDERGKVLREVRAAIEAGIRLDVGHGANGFSFVAAERALDQGVTPYTISSDLHAYNRNGPVFDLATTLSKFLMLGMSVDQVIERATINPAKAFPFPGSPGTLAEGATADIALFRMENGPITFVDSHGLKRSGSKLLRPWITLRAGDVYGRLSAARRFFSRPAEPPPGSAPTPPSPTTSRD